LFLNNVMTSVHYAKTKFHYIFRLLHLMLFSELNQSWYRDRNYPGITIAKSTS
jgi:hypothetical protein